MKKKIPTQKNKELWNEAIRAAANEMFLYDGLIPDKRDRIILKERIIEKLSYKNVPLANI